MEYFKLKQTLIKAEYLVIVALTLNCKMVDKFCKAQNISSSEYVSKYFKPKTPENTTNSKLAKLESGIADIIFSKAKVMLSGNSDVNIEAFKSISNDASFLLLNAETFSGSAARTDDITNAEKKEYLMLTADILTTMLDAKMYPHGCCTSVYRFDDRAMYVKKIEDCYREISKIDPDFDAPNVPSEGFLPLVDVNTPTAQSSGGCYVATAVYGSYDCPQVWTLRRFRDHALAATWYGRAFIHTYYAVSPTLAKWFGHTAWFRNLWRGKLDRMVSRLQKQGYESTPYQDRPW